ncbi:DegT/DnrJ/EryC1/StrS family aminotransferase [Persephonella sp.]
MLKNRFIIAPDVIIDFFCKCKEEDDDFFLKVINHLIKNKSGYISMASLSKIILECSRNKSESEILSFLNQFQVWKTPSYINWEHPLIKVNKSNIDKYLIHLTAESLDAYIITQDTDLLTLSDRAVNINKALEIIENERKVIHIPFLDLLSQNIKLFSVVEKKLDQIFNSSRFICGGYVKEFEKKFADYLGAKYCIGVNSGTSALIITLMAIGLKPGDEVIMPVNTFIATAEAVSILGGKPVFVDIHPEYYTIDVTQIEGKITERTKAIIPVHLYGQCADMDLIMEIAKKYNLWVIEDACQAHGAEYKGRKAGTIGHIGCFSFYPGKNLGAWGEAGACVTNDDVLAERMYKIRNHGGIKKYQHDILGGNFRMEEIQGAVLSEKLNYLDEWNEGRRKVAKWYNEILRDLECKGVIKLPKEAPYNRHIYHLFVVQINNIERNKLINKMKNYRVDIGIHYPIPLHKTNVYLEDKSYPVAEKIQDKIISLPIYENLQEERIELIWKLLKKVLSSITFL